MVLKNKKMIEVNIKAGWKSGTKINFANEGDYQPECGARQTIQFVIEENQTQFSREKVII